MTRSSPSSVASRFAALRRVAAALPECEESTACRGTAVQSARYAIGGKAFAFLRPESLMVKLGPSAAEAEAAAKTLPAGTIKTGKGGWTTVRLDGATAPPPSTLARWIAESRALFATGAPAKPTRAAALARTKPTRAAAPARTKATGRAGARAGATETFVLLLRGVNVGTAKRLAMADLRAVLAALGAVDVATLLNSGNAVYRAAPSAPAADADRVAAAIQAHTGFAVPVVLKTRAEWARVAAEIPSELAARDPAKLLVLCVAGAAARKVFRAAKPPLGPEESFVAGDEAAFLYCGRGVAESKAAVALLKAGPPPPTGRNATTVRKLDELAARVAGAEG